MPALKLAGLALLTLLSVPALAVIDGQGPSSAAGGNDAVDTEALYKKGASSYRKRCARCHGFNMVNPGAGIFDLRSLHPDEKERFVDVVTNGRNAMPAWGHILQPADIDTLWIYVSNQGAPAP